MISTAHQIPKIDGLKERALNFLGLGIDNTRVAQALGCDPSYISQLLADPIFAEEVSMKRLSVLREATDRDDRLNKLEDALIGKTEQLVKSPLHFTRPMETVRALSIINSLKRRGAGESFNTTINNTIVALQLPDVIKSKFVVDVNNQVVEVSETPLITIQSSSMEKLASQSHLKKGVSGNELSINDLK